MIWNETIECMNREEMRRLQSIRLRRVVEHAYHNSPFYRKKMQEMGITPEDIHSIDDIVKLPFTVKQDLRDNYPFGLIAVRSRRRPPRQVGPHRGDTHCSQKEAHETFPCASHCSGHAFAVTATLPALTAMPLLSTSATTSVDPLAAAMSALPSHLLQLEQSSPIAGTATSTLYL